MKLTPKVPLLVGNLCVQGSGDSRSQTGRPLVRQSVPQLTTMFIDRGVIPDSPAAVYPKVEKSVVNRSSLGRKDAD